MALINNQISARNFELIRDRICTILAAELAIQTAALGVTVWGERRIPFMPNELTAVNVSYDNTDFDSKHVGSKASSNRYYIDIHASKPNSASGTGDVLVSQYVQKIAGIIDYILEYPAYSTLGFTPGFIAHTIIENITIGGMEKIDSEHNIVCRLVFKVDSIESTGQVQPAVAEGYDTQVKIEMTNFGHKYTLNNE